MQQNYNQLIDLRNQLFYHLAPSSTLIAGDIIQQGNWGKMIHEIGVQHSAYWREFIVEYIRQWNFPHKPSRFNCAYVCIELEDILFFKKHNQPDNTLYKVKISNPDCNHHVGCYNYLPPNTPGSIKGHNRSHPIHVAIGYWSGFTIKMTGAIGDCWELLVESSLEIVERVE